MKNIKKTKTEGHVYKKVFVHNNMIYWNTFKLLLHVFSFGEQLESRATHLF